MHRLSLVSITDSHPLQANMPSVSFLDRSTQSTYKAWVRTLTDSQLKDEIVLCTDQIGRANFRNAVSMIGGILGTPFTGGGSLVGGAAGVAEANAKGVVYRRCLNMAKAEQERRANSWFGGWF